MKQIFTFVFLCICMFKLQAQTYSYLYPNIAVTGSPSYPRNSVSGTATFASQTVVPNFTWTVTSSSGNKIRSFSTTASSTEMTLTNPWETKYGQVTTSTSGFNLRHAGNSSSNGQPLGIPIVITLTFPTPAKAYGWGFMLLDMDVDQVDVSATKPNGSAFSSAEINAWFRGVGNANNSSDGSPCWNAGNATIVGSEHSGAPCTRRTTILNSSSDGDGGYAWLEPNAPVKTLTITYYNLQTTATPSFRFYLAASRAVSATGTVYNDVTGTTGGFNGAGIGSAGSNPLYAYLTNNAGLIMDSTHVASDGSFSFLPQYSSAGTTPYKVVLSTSNANIGSSSPSVTLPAAWRPTGENIGTSYAAANNDGDGAANQSLGINAGSANISNIHFGIQRPPESAVHNAFAGMNPGGTTSVTLDPAWFMTSNVGSNPDTRDFHSGSVTAIRITSLPANATSITINGTTYGSCGGCTAWPVAGVTVPYSAVSGPTQVIAVDPLEVLEVVVPFAAIDNAGAEDAGGGNITLSFAALLPVDWLHFNALQKNNFILLQWATSNEQNNKGFIIEHSSDGQSWSGIGFVESQATGINGAQNFKYSFNDHRLLSGKNFYRLKQTDADGKYSYSKVAVVQVANSKSSIKLYPNPAVDVVIIAGLKANDVVQLYNILGQRLQHFKAAGGMHQIDCSKLPPAVYSIVISDATGTITGTHKIVKRK